MEGLAEVQRPEKLTLARRAGSVSVARTMECGRLVEGPSWDVLKSLAKVLFVFLFSLDAYESHHKGLP